MNCVIFLSYEQLKLQKLDLNDDNLEAINHIIRHTPKQFLFYPNLLPELLNLNPILNILPLQLLNPGYKLIRARNILQILHQLLRPQLTQPFHLTLQNNKQILLQINVLLEKVLAQLGPVYAFVVELVEGLVGAADGA